MFLCVWPVPFFILASAEFVLMLQMDNFPIDLLWCWREWHCFPIANGKSYVHSPYQLWPCWGAARRKVDFRFPLSTLLFSSPLLWLVLMAHHCPGLLHTCKLLKYSCSYQTCLLPSCREAEVRWWRSEGKCLFFVLSLAGPRRYMLFSFQCWDQSWERGQLKPTQKTNSSELSVLHLKVLIQGEKKENLGRIGLFCLFFNLCLSFISLTSLLAIMVVFIMPMKVSFGKKPCTTTLSCQSTSI